MRAAARAHPLVVVLVIALASRLFLASVAWFAHGTVDEWPPYDRMLDPINRVFLPRADIATETLVAGLVESFEVEVANAEADLETLLGELATEGLIEFRSAPA